MLDDDALDEHLRERVVLETSYYRVKGFLLAQNKSPLCLTPQSPTYSTRQVPPSTSQVRLPDVKLPVFDGSLENWLNFHDLFVSLVHSSTELSNIQKFYYLRSSLSASALQLIQSISISALNYPVAWNLLLDHFQNPARLKQTYVDAMFEFSALKKESASELHSLVEKFEANVKVLHQLGERTNHWDLLLIRMLSTCLDSTTRRDWEEFATTKGTVTFKDLTSFIQRRVTVLQSIQPKISESTAPVPPKRQVQRPVYSIEASPIYPPCSICSDHHPVYHCEHFLQLTLEEKENEIRRHQLCRNCLRRGHVVKDCSSSSSCRKCGARHHTILCTNDWQSPCETLPSTSALATAIKSVNCTSAVGLQQRTVLLATALIDIIDDEGTKHTGRALLDSGSECCFISERFSQRMKVQRKNIRLPISGIGQSATHARTKFTSRIQSRIGAYTTLVEFIVLPQVTVNLPGAPVDTSNWNMPPCIRLADPTFDCTNPIDVVIGAEVFFELFKVPGRIPLGDNLPVLVNSELGWVVCGKSEVCLPTPIIANFATIGRTTPHTTQRSTHYPGVQQRRPNPNGFHGRCQHTKFIDQFESIACNSATTSFRSSKSPKQTAFQPKIHPTQIPARLEGTASNHRGQRIANLRQVQSPSSSPKEASVKLPHRMTKSSNRTLNGNSLIDNQYKASSIARNFIHRRSKHQVWYDCCIGSTSK